jgi:hypothetical protein
MKFTIIPSDATAYKDGLAFHSLDVSGVPANVHALQFNDATNKGHIEFKTDENDQISAPEKITELPTWAVTVFTAWDNAKVAFEAAEAQRIIDEAAAAQEFAKA